MTADVSILIPAYRSEAFIDRTLHFARGQTYSQVEIIVSVDPGGDATTERAYVHAADDPRVRVIEQPKRLGWAGNVNALLESVQTPFAFIYFHDDILLPQYTAVLLRALESAPEALSAHCDMGHFGARDDISFGRAYDGAATRRLMTLMLAPYRGSPLRSLLRRQILDRLRIPEGKTGGLWANEPFLMQMVALGRAIHVPQTLYLRWDKRPGGLTDSWSSLSAEAHLGAIAETLDLALSHIEDCAATKMEKSALLLALYLNILPRVQSIERRFGQRAFGHPEQLHPAFADLQPELVLSWLADRNKAGAGDDFAEITGWAHERWQRAKQDLRDRIAVE